MIKNNIQINKTLFYIIHNKTLQLQIKGTTPQKWVNCFVSLILLLLQQTNTKADTAEKAKLIYCPDYNLIKTICKPS